MIKIENIVLCLRKTLDEYDRKPWEHSVYYNDGTVVKPGVSEADFLYTIGNYRDKLLIADMHRTQTKLIRRANRILNKKVLEEIGENKDVEMEFS